MGIPPTPNGWADMFGEVVSAVVGFIAFLLIATLAVAWLGGTIYCLAIGEFGGAFMVFDTPICIVGGLMKLD